MALLSTTAQLAREWGSCALNLAFPWPESAAAEPVSVERPFCENCAEPFPALEGRESVFQCAHCLEHAWDFAWARSGFRTEGQVLEAIVGFKYRQESYRCEALVGWLTETFDRYGGEGTWDALVPVPLYHLRRRERGFNQSEELAIGLGKKRSLPVWNCLSRTRETATQTRLERPDRWANMKGAFRLKAGFDVRGRRLLLIDDVFTTGATANACAHALAEAGADRLAVLTVARS